MKYESKLVIQIFSIGTIILLFGLFVAYRYSYLSNLQRELQHTISLVDEVSLNIEKLMLEKVKTNRTLSIAPILKKALKTSNNNYDRLSEKERNEKIILLNKRWKTIDNENDAFILEFTNNKVAQFLKEQQNNIRAEYGEIFLTNKYGVIIASTAKLTTLAHAHKYWWKGAFNNGKGAIFFDDRGYDESVGGYVLGLVIPIKMKNEISGILKVNLNILGSVSEMIRCLQKEGSGDFKLIRSGGEIIFESESAPLSTRIPNLVYNKIQVGDECAFILEDSVNDLMIGISEIKITSGNSEGFLFGGSFESADHQKGNTGESWYIMNCQNLPTLLEPLEKLMFNVFIIGLLLIVILALAAFIFGKLAIKPLKQLIVQSEKIAEADFSARIIITRNDEFGLLGKAFNKMTEELTKTTTSIKNLELEVEQRIIAEQSLKESEAKLNESNNTKDKFFSIIAHDLKSPFSAMLGFSNLLCEKFEKFDVNKQKKFLGALNSDLKKTYKLLENLLLWSQTQRGIIDFKPENNNLYLLSSETIDLLSQSSENKLISIVNEISEEIIIKADKDMLATILRNLISNAIKFTPRSGKISISACSKKDENNQNYMEVSVKDNGTGIDPNIKQKLFKITESVSTKGTEKEEGTGLGLILCKEFVKKHGGKIWVESEIGAGASFKFTIPGKQFY